MPRRVDKKCVACAQLDAAQARQLHGKKGDDCWNEKRCPRKRSHYRHRQELNEKRRLRRQQVADDVSAVAQVETVSLPVAEASVPYANLWDGSSAGDTLERSDRHNAYHHSTALCDRPNESSRFCRR